MPPFSRVTSGWLTTGYSQFASARTHPPHCRQEAAVPPRAVRGCPPACRAVPCRGGQAVPLASQRPPSKTTIHMLKLGRIARRGAAYKRTGKIPMIRPSRRSVVSAKSHPIRLSCSSAQKNCRCSTRRTTRQKRRFRRAQPAALAQHEVGSTPAKRHMFLSRFAHILAVAG